MSIKAKFKSFFQTREVSDETIEFTRMFIMPFVGTLKKRGLSVDDVIAAFFAVDDRKLFYATANRSFKLPGELMITGARSIAGAGPRSVRKGQKMLVVFDRIDNNAQVEIKIDGEFRNYRLKKFEFETIKDWIDPIGE